MYTFNYYITIISTIINKFLYIVEITASKYINNIYRNKLWHFNKIVPFKNCALHTSRIM